MGAAHGQASLSKTSRVIAASSSLRALGNNVLLGADC
jgi:hypothetical protein